MSTPIGIVQAQAILEEAQRAAKAATANVATTRERVAIGEASDADLKRALRSAEKAADAVETCEAGVRVAKRVQEAQDEEDRRVMERVEAERRRAAQARFAKATTATAATLKRTLAEMDQLARDFAEAELVIGNRSGASSSNLLPWGIATTALSRLFEIFEVAAPRVNH